MSKILLIMALGLMAGGLGVLIGAEFGTPSPEGDFASAGNVSMKRLMEDASKLPEGYVYWFDHMGNLVTVQRCKTRSTGLDSILASQREGLTRIELCR